MGGHEGNLTGPDLAAGVAAADLAPGASLLGHAQGEPVLLDANRTPGVARAIQPLMKEGARNLAEGLHELLTGVTAPMRTAT